MCDACDAKDQKIVAMAELGQQLVLRIKELQHQLDASEDSLKDVMELRDNEVLLRKTIDSLHKDKREKDQMISVLEAKVHELEHQVEESGRSSIGATGRLSSSNNMTSAAARGTSTATGNIIRNSNSSPCLSFSDDFGLVTSPSMSKAVYRVAGVQTESLDVVEASTQSDEWGMEDTTNFHSVMVEGCPSPGAGDDDHAEHHAVNPDSFLGWSRSVEAGTNSYGVSTSLEDSVYRDVVMKGPLAIQNFADAIAAQTAELFLHSPRLTNRGTTNRPVVAVRAPSSPTIDLLDIEKFFLMTVADNLKAPCEVCANKQRIGSGDSSECTRYAEVVLPKCATVWKLRHEVRLSYEEEWYLTELSTRTIELGNLPTATREGPLQLLVPGKMFGETWQPAYGVIHQLFLYVFDSKQPQAKCTHLFVLRGAQIKIPKGSIHGKATVLQGKTIVTPDVVPDSQKQQFTVAFGSERERSLWMSDFYEAARQCPHKCSMMWQHFVPLRNLLLP
eukprot:PhF_6_TR27843/c0_g1_i1/m.40636